MMLRTMGGAAFLALASCGAEIPTKREIRDDVNGVSLVIEHIEGPALSQPEDRIVLVTGNDKKVVFEGYGGAEPSLFPSKKGLLVVSYCGGTIRTTESFALNDDQSGQSILVKVQPIITSNVEVDGKVVCENVAEEK
jgi:hypothetical protein